MYGSAIEHDMYVDVAGREQVIENVAVAYPTGDGLDRHVIMDLVLIILDTKRTSYASLKSLENYSHPRDAFDPLFGWHLVQNGELPTDNDSGLWYLGKIPPFPWDQLSVPDLCTNWRVLQATAHFDNLALVNVPEEPFAPIRPPPCYFENTRQLFAGAIL